MKLHERKERLEVGKSDLSGSVFDDVNLSGLRLSHANLAGAAIGDSRYEGMTIDGIPVTAMIAAYKAAQAGRTDG